MIQDSKKPYLSQEHKFAELKWAKNVRELFKCM